MSGVRGGWCVDRGGRVRFIKVATQIEPPSRVSQRSLRTGRGSSVRHGAHQARIVPCGAPFVGIRTAGNRPMSTNWRHAASGRAGLHTPPDRSEPEDGVGARTPRGVSSSSPDDSRPSRCLQTMLRKALSSPDARRAAQTNSVRRAASTVPPIEPSHGRGRAAAAVRFYGVPRTRRG